jgi:RNase P subunit RPR2
MGVEASGASKQWRCPGCGNLLGVRNGTEIEVRYKDARYVVTGAVRAHCRRCGRETATTTTASAASGVRS